MKLISEYTENKLDFLIEKDEKSGKKKYAIQGIFAQAETKNRNGRIYPKAIMEKALTKYNTDQVSKGRAVGPKVADTYRRFLRSSKKDQDVIDLTPSIFTEFLDVKQATEERRTFCVVVIGSGDSEDFNLKGYDLAARAIAELKEDSYQLKFVCAPRGRGEEIADKLLKQ